MCVQFAACQISITDPGCHCRVGDAFKLYEKFLSEDGSGVVGIILVVLIDVVLTLVAAVLLYTFYIKLHMSGRLVDLYTRLCSSGDTVVPLDGEV